MTSPLTNLLSKLDDSWKSNPPAESLINLRKTIGVRSTNALRVVMKLTTRTTVIMPILKLLDFRYRSAKT